MSFATNAPGSDRPQSPGKVLEDAPNMCPRRPTRPTDRPTQPDPTSHAIKTSPPIAQTSDHFPADHRHTPAPPSVSAPTVQPILAAVLAADCPVPLPALHSCACFSV